MDVIVRISEDEYYKILDELPVHPFGGKSRKDFVKVVANTVDIPIKKIDKVVVDFKVFDSDYIVAEILKAEKEGM